LVGIVTSRYQRHVLLKTPGGGSYNHAEVQAVMDAVKQILCRNNVHSSTIQPEFVNHAGVMVGANGLSTIAPLTEGTCSMPGGGCIEACDTEDSCCNKETRRQSFQTQMTLEDYEDGSAIN